MSAITLCLIILGFMFLAALAGSKLAQRMLGVLTGIVLFIGLWLWFITPQLPG